MAFSGTDRAQIVTNMGAVQSEEIRGHDDFSDRLLTQLELHRERVEEILDESLTGWRAERLTAADGALLRLGIVELLAFQDVPPKAAINEYIELAKQFGDAESARFVNGVLDRVRRDLEQSGNQS